MAEPSLVKLWSQAVVRKAASLFFPREQFAFQGLFFGPARTTYNYAADVGDGLTSSVVMPVVQWLMRSFPEAPLVVRSRKGDELEVVAEHPLVQLVDRPNEAYPGTILWMATITDWAWFGESYWRILRSRGGQPAELWWIPPWSIKPKWPDDGSVFISHYDYQPSIGPAIPLDVEEVIHFRHGLDPRNMRHGLPPLRAILQDIWTDAESANFVGAMLRNMGIPGLIVSPKGDERLSQAEVEQVKAYIASRFTGDHRGQPLALGGPTDVHKLSLSPTELDMSALRNTAEERVCSALGIPSAVVGFKSGLENSKVGATMAEFVKLAWSNGMVPMQRLMAAELQMRLLPLFETSPDTFLVGWNYDEVSSLQEDQNALAKRYEGLWEKGLLKKSECRQALGYESDPEDEIYFHPNSGTVVDPKDQMPEPVPLPGPAALPAAPGANGNGNGNGSPNGNGAVQQRALKQGTLADLIHGQISRHAQTMDKPPRSLLRLAAKLWRAEQAQYAKFEAMILPILKRYGAVAGTAAREALFSKAVPQDIINTLVIHERLPFVQVRAELAQVYEQMYEIMSALTVELMQAALQVGPVDASRVQAQVRMLAHERVGLLDLEAEARETILRSLDEARLQGFTEDQMIAMIEQKIPSGRWTSPEMRAQILARNESRFASNQATAEFSRQSGIGQILVLDARLGPTDAECEARNGWVVSPTEARMLSEIEHVNGTLSLLPLVNQQASSISS